MTESNVLLANEANFATACVVRFVRIWSVFLLYQHDSSRSSWIYLTPNHKAHILAKPEAHLTTLENTSIARKGSERKHSNTSIKQFKNDI